MDIKCNFLSLDQDYGARLVWDAVYSRIAPGEYKPPTIVVEKTQKLWRKRVRELHAVGYEKLPEVRVTYARNCPPVCTEFKAERMIKPCNLSKVCPFCWSRQVCLSAWNRFKTQMFKHEKSKLTDPRYAIYLVVRSAFADSAEELVGAISDDLGGNIQRVSVGSITVSTISPVVPGEYENDVLPIRNFVKSLHVVDREEDVYVNPTTTVYAFQPLQRATASDLIGRLTGYPLGMLMCDPTTVKLALDSTFRKHSIRYTGMFYKQNKS